MLVYREKSFYCSGYLDSWMMDANLFRQNRESRFRSVDVLSRREIFDGNIGCT